MGLDSDQGHSDKRSLERCQRKNRRAMKHGGNAYERDFLADRLRIPDEIAKGTMRLTFTGNGLAYVENYERILEYSEHGIRLLGKKGKIRLAGEKLRIEYYTCDDMMIKGIFREFYWEERD